MTGAEAVFTACSAAAAIAGALVFWRRSAHSVADPWPGCTEANQSGAAASFLCFCLAVFHLESLSEAARTVHADAPALGLAACSCGCLLRRSAGGLDPMLVHFRGSRGEDSPLFHRESAWTLLLLVALFKLPTSLSGQARHGRGSGRVDENPSARKLPCEIDSSPGSLRQLFKKTDSLGTRTGLKPSCESD